MTYRRALSIVLIVVLSLALLSAAAYAVLNSRNRAQPEAYEALHSDDEVIITRVEGQDWYSFAPAAGELTTGLIIYPGGFVDPVAYAPIAREIARRGYLVLLDPMPLNLAVTNIQSADAILRAFPEIDHWAIAGHSLGGAMAAEYVKTNPEAIQGLGLWAAYPAENTDLSALPLAVVSLYGDIDGVASMSEVTGAAVRLPGTARFTLIPGANHTQFGTYGEGLQRGDNPATISREEQQAQVIQGMAQLLESIARN